MKTLIITLLLSAAMLAQITGNDPRLPTIPRDPNGIRGSVMLQYDPNASTWNYFGAGTTVHSYFDTDTLIMASSGADTTGSGSTNDTLIHYFGGKWLYGFICVDDSQKAASGALTDSVYVDRYDTATATWRSAMVGLKDMYTNVVGSNPVVPTNNLQKMYLINEPYPMTYRVRYSAYWGNTQALVRKTIIRWIWKQ